MKVKVKIESFAASGFAPEEKFTANVKEVGVMSLIRCLFVGYRESVQAYGSTREETEGQAIAKILGRLRRTLELKKSRRVTKKVLEIE